jgi:integrase
METRRINHARTLQFERCKLHVSWCLASELVGLEELDDGKWLLHFGQALALTWPQVDVRGREIRIWPSDEWQPKDNEPREVPISDALLPLLTGPRRSQTWVFPCSTGERWACWPKLQFDRARERAGLLGGPHTLRHTFASHFLARQPDIGLLAQVLGHSEESVTRLYQHMLPERLARARNVVSIGVPAPATRVVRTRRTAPLPHHQ